MGWGEPGCSEEGEGAAQGELESPGKEEPGREQPGDPGKESTGSHGKGSGRRFRKVMNGSPGEGKEPNREQPGAPGKGRSPTGSNREPRGREDPGRRLREVMNREPRQGQSPARRKREPQEGKNPGRRKREPREGREPGREQPGASGKEVPGATGREDSGRRLREEMNREPRQGQSLAGRKREPQEGGSPARSNREARGREEARPGATGSPRKGRDWSPGQSGTREPRAGGSPGDRLGPAGTDLDRADGRGRERLELTTGLIQGWEWEVSGEELPFKGAIQGRRKKKKVFPQSHSSPTPTSTEVNKTAENKVGPVH
ncbi:uncharacterized protein [Melanerpes formicivorus]|uniref:uncharacterized protein isoform X2 n=1 Tax=Melanerpes formicivorus TaxID=211600 RepID=UPI00358EF95D